MILSQIVNSIPKIGSAANICYIWSDFPFLGGLCCFVKCNRVSTTVGLTITDR